MRYGILCAVSVLAYSLATAGTQFMGYRSFNRASEQAKDIAALGVDVRAFGICNTFAGAGWFYSPYPAVWKGFGEYDWAVLDRMFSDYISETPDVKLLCLIDLNSPPWFQRKMHFDSFDSISSAACAPMWRDAAAEWLKAVVTRCEEKWGDRIAAYALMAGQTTEWFEHDFSRTSRVKNAAWRAWCAERGFDGGDAVPSDLAMGRGAFEGIIFDPATERGKIEFWKFHNGVIADALLGMARVAKAAAPRKEIGSFFGYFNICNKSLGSQGHLALERVAASPDIDFFLSPATYTGRECGFGPQTMTIPGTLRRHGKRFFHEIDFRPHTDPKWLGYGGYWKTAEDSIAGNVREAAYAIINHASFWWFDQQGTFYSFPGMHERIAKIAEIKKRFESDRSPLLADVLFVSDPESACAMVDREGAQREEGPACPDGFAPSLGVGEGLGRIVGRTGFAFDTCALADLPHLDLSHVKAFVLPGVWTIDGKAADILRRFVLKSGKTAVWAYAPGVSDGRTLDAARVRTWAGVDFRTPDVATTGMDGWTSVYAYDYRKLTAEKFVEILTAAGCHRWTDVPSAVVANERLLSVHVKDGGRMKVRLPRACAKVVDLLSGETVATDAASFDCEFASPDTRIFEMVGGQVSGRKD